MNHIKTIFSLLVLIILSGNSFAQTSVEIDQLMEKLKSAQNVEELYTLKYNIDKYTRRTDLSIEEQKKLNRAYVMLSSAFKSKNHFKNAADVYKDYLDLNKKYLINYNTYIKDSILASQQKIKSAETSKINELNAEINSLNTTRLAVEGLKSKYYSTGTIATIAILVVFLLIFITRNRAIRLTQNQLNANREKLLAMNKSVLDAKLLKGSLAFAKFSVQENSDLLEKLIAEVSLTEDKKTFSKEIQALQKAKDAYTGFLSQ